eukprot:CAMPEP_0183538636 /NCGR_PEP_ID=MMETSP0371-20130417/29722_1 /TAXON_ID=268820 /ORGANISM="Peridinium aciculiferum, Strain PAER-2" /LENGTH=129 /DNA_ID=CAMNT_0025739499 /DNA_START=52 /DNA_END=442 /DNA_ORIENTATION=-
MEVATATAGATVVTTAAGAMAVAAVTSATRAAAAVGMAATAATPATDAADDGGVWFVAAVDQNSARSADAALLLEHTEHVQKLLDDAFVKVVCADDCCAMSDTMPCEHSDLAALVMLSLAVDSVKGSAW